MTWTKKEQDFLKDLQNEEKVCIEKYHRAAESACDPTLKGIFNGIEKAEQHHYDTLTQMLSGTMPQPKKGGKQQGKQQQQNQQPAPGSLKSKASRAEKQQDAFLLADLLGTEKYVSAEYNTAVFEFKSPEARQTLSGIQLQEQNHGKQLADYMMANNMYC